MSINIDSILEKAIAEANRQNIPVTISIVDMGGHLLAVRRMEGCSYFALEASRLKAITACQLKAPTHVLAAIGQKVPELEQALNKNTQVLTLPGGFPIMIDAEVAAGLGIAGGNFAQDETIASAALA